MRSQGNAQMVDTAQASLLVRGGVNSGMIVSLSKRPITLGRRSDNDVVVDESTVSRRHALIMETPSGYAVRDLNTINGTFVNQRDIGQEECILKHGDTIRLAASEISYVFRQEGKHTVRIQVEPLPTGVITTGQRNVRQPPSVVDQEPKPAFNEKPEVALVGKESMLLEFLESKQGNVVSREDIHRQGLAEYEASRPDHRDLRHVTPPR